MERYATRKPVFIDILCQSRHVSSVEYPLHKQRMLSRQVMVSREYETGRASKYRRPILAFHSAQGGSTTPFNVCDPPMLTARNSGNRILAAIIGPSSFLKSMSPPTDNADSRGAFLSLFGGSLPRYKYNLSTVAEMSSSLPSLDEKSQKTVPESLPSTKFLPITKADHFLTHSKHSHLDNMASAVDTTNYRLLPEERASTDDSNVDTRQFPMPSDTRTRRESKSFTFRYHPTVLLRLIAAILLFTGLMMNAVEYPEPAALVFLILAFLRQVQILFNHYLSHRVRLRSPIQIITNNVRLPASPLPRTGPPPHRYPGFHVCLDIILVLGLIIALSIEAAQQSPSHYWRSNYMERKFAGAIVGISSR